MKKVIMAVAGFVLGCAAVMSGAQAASNNIYKSTSGKPFSVEDVRQITFDAGNARTYLVYTNGSSSENFSDNGTVFNKIKADHPEWLTYGTNTLFVPGAARTINCFGAGTGTYTVLAWRNTGAQDITGDGCTLYQQAQQKSNNP